MKHIEVYQYKPRAIKKESDTESKADKFEVTVNIGFAIEAPHTNATGLCVYHKNRLIKPFWRVYSSASSIGRGVIGYLEVDFVAPAHDKQV